MTDSPSTPGSLSTAHAALPRSHPKDEQVSEAGIISFLDAVNDKRLGLHSFMMIRHGSVVAEAWWQPYAANRPHMLYSLSKSFTSTAVGMAIAEGRLSLDDSLLSFFPDYITPEIESNMSSVRVRHLLSMTTGHTSDTMPGIHQQGDGDWVRGFLSQPITREPGTHFLYNTGASYMLSAIVQTVTGERLLDYLQPRLFHPLGITGATWEESPQGINTGGFGLSLRTEDIAKFGQLYLNGGKWNGVQLVPEDWVQAATSMQTPTWPDGTDNPDWCQGYGYQFWRCRHDVYRGDGAFGQFCIVLPSHDAVIAMTSGSANMQGILDEVWAHLLPALGSPGTAVQENADQFDTHRELTAKIQALQIDLYTPPVSPVLPVLDVSQMAPASSSDPAAHPASEARSGPGPDPQSGSRPEFESAPQSGSRPEPGPAPQSGPRPEPESGRLSRAGSGVRAGSPSEVWSEAWPIAWSGAKFRFDPNPLYVTGVQFNFTADSFSLSFTTEDTDYTVTGEYGAWRVESAPEHGFLSLEGKSNALAVRGTWRSPDQFQLILCYVETPFVYTVECTLHEESPETGGLAAAAAAPAASRLPRTLSMTSSRNVHFGSPEAPFVIHAVREP